jgi:hypothetical protein
MSRKLSKSTQLLTLKRMSEIMTRIVSFLTRNRTVAILCAANLLGLLWGATSIVTASQQRKVLLSNPPPSVISYQGYITSDGMPFSGTGYFKFAVVDEPSGDGATNYWANDGTSIGEPSSNVTLTVSGGLFNVLLGNTSLVGIDYAIDHTVFSETDTYLRVWFSETGSAFQALEPNPRFSSVAYALRAQVADSGPDETDPIFDASPANAISTTNITDWDTAYGWGDHSEQGYLTSVGNVKQLVQDFVVAAGESVTAGDVVSFLDGYIQKGLVIGDEITYGSEYVFNYERTSFNSAVALSDTKFVVAYSDVGNSEYGTAVIGELSEGTIAYGSEYVFHSAQTYYISAAVLSDTKIVVAFQDSGNSNYGTAVIGDVSGTTITFGSEYVFNSGATDYISAAALSDSKFVVAFRDMGNSYYGSAVIGDVSGTTITYGSEYVLNSEETLLYSVAALSDTKIVVVYTDRGNSDYGTTLIGNISGTTITYGSEYVFNSAETYYISAAALSDTKIVVEYSDYSNSHYGTAVIGDITGTNISFGSEYVFNSVDTSLSSATASSDSKFVVAYSDSGNSDFGTMMIGEISGTIITYGSEFVFKSATTYGISTVALSDLKFVVAYRDWDNSKFGTVVIGDIPTFGNIVGFASESKTGGQNLPVIIGGVSDVHSGLIPGEIYYRDLSGNLTTTETNWPIGLAISETELLLDIDIYGR